MVQVMKKISYDSVYRNKDIDADALDKDMSALKVSQKVSSSKIAEQKRKVDAMAKEYSSDFTKQFKDKIIKRDGGKCVLCGATEDLTCHHILYQKKLTRSDECVTLCRACNTRVNTDRARWSAYFKNMMHYKILRNPVEDIGRFMR
jgi:hypothetical protein